MLTTGTSKFKQHEISPPREGATRTPAVPYEGTSGA